MRSQIILVTILVICGTALLAQASNEDESTETVAVAQDVFEVKGRLLLNFRGNTTHPEGGPAVANAQQQKETLRACRVNMKGSNGNGFLTTLVRQDGSFSFPEVAPGSYLLEVTSPHLIFMPIRVQVSKRNKGQVKAKIVEPINQILSYPLVIRPEYRASYFQEVSNPLATIYAMLTSPMILMTGGMLALVGFMQFLGGPEAVQEMQQELNGGPSQQQAERSPIDSMPTLIPSRNNLPRYASGSK